MGARSQACVVEDVKDVEPAHDGAVDEVLALAGAIHAPGDGDLCVVDGKGCARVVEDELDFGI